MNLHKLFLVVNKQYQALHVLLWYLQLRPSPSLLFILPNFPQAQNLKEAEALIAELKKKVKSLNEELEEKEKKMKKEMADSNVRFTGKCGSDITTVGDLLLYYHSTTSNSIGIHC